MRRAAAVGIVLLLAGALGGLARVPWRAGDPSVAHIRLSWRYRGEAVRECRPLTEEERAALPAHMRREEVCERRLPPYRLRVVVDGREAVADRVRGGGARGDRPIYVFRDLRVAPGVHGIRVVFGPSERTGAAELPEAPGEAERGYATERAGEGAAGAARGGPAELVLERELRLEGGEIALVTYDPQAGELVLRRAAEAEEEP